MKAGKAAKALVLLLALGAGLFLGYRQTEPIRAPAGFAERQIPLAEAQPGPDPQLMLSHIRGMASAVHSVDSDGIRVTHAYLEDQLTQMGYAYEAERYALGMEEVLALERARAAFRGKAFEATEESIREYSGIGDKPAMNLKNIVVTVDAPGTSETILFVAHTDSVRMGPGAFDDIVSCAALLEGLRQLKTVTPLRDLVFLFADGEEQGMLGAAKFVQDHPELAGVTRLVINVEARGNKGSLLMFETSEDNYGMVSEYARAVSHPFSLSIGTAVYRTMDTDTDLTRFMMAGYPGMNFAVIEGADVYHEPEDNYETFDRDSAAHYLETVTELVTHFAASPKLQLEADEDSVHFPLLPGNLFIMRQSEANLLSYAAFALFLAVSAWLLAAKRIRLGPLLGAFFLQLVCMGAAGGASYLVVKLVAQANGLSGYRDFLRYQGAEAVFYGLLAGALALSCLVFSLFSSKTRSPLSAAAGVLLLPAVLALATTFVLPSANYLFSLTALAGLAAILLTQLFRPGAALYAGLVAFLTLLLFVPLVMLVFVALSFQSAFLDIALAQLPWTMILGQMFLVKHRGRIPGAP